MLTPTSGDSHRPFGRTLAQTRPLARILIRRFRFAFLSTCLLGGPTGLKRFSASATPPTLLDDDGALRDGMLPRRVSFRCVTGCDDLDGTEFHLALAEVDFGAHDRRGN